MIIATDQPQGPYYLCDRCGWSDDWCTCHPGYGRFERRPGDAVDLEWRRERGRTVAINRKQWDPRNVKRKRAS
jgi:hypothetical protein